MPVEQSCLADPCWLVAKCLGPECACQTTSGHFIECRLDELDPALPGEACATSLPYCDDAQGICVLGQCLERCEYGCPENTQPVTESEVCLCLGLRL